MCKLTSTYTSRPSLESLGPSLKPEDLDQIQPEEKTHVGTVRKIMEEKSYGFIQTEDGSDLFFMLNNVLEPWVVVVGDQVSYHRDEDSSHSGKSRAVRVMPSLLARPSCHSPGGSVIRQTNALRSSMVRMTISAKSTKTSDEWTAEVDSATKKFYKHLVEFAGMDQDEAVDFADVKIAKAMQSGDSSSLPKHLQKIVKAKQGLEECLSTTSDFSDALLDRAEQCLRLSQTYDSQKDGSTTSSNSPTAAARAVIAPARMADTNRFHEGEQHTGEIAQIVRSKFGFIIAETTAASKQLKQKLFFHLNGSPEGITVGDKVTFLVQKDPYNSDKMIARELAVTQKATQAPKPPAKKQPTRRHRGKGNDGPVHRSSIDGNWRRGCNSGMQGRDILHSADSQQAWSSFRKGNSQQVNRQW